MLHFSNAVNTSSIATRFARHSQLREAENELNSLSLGDASVASPFTYRGTSISCCKKVALQGRCTLVTMLQIYKILGVNCLVTAVTLSRLTINGVKQGETQLTAVGIVVAALFFFVSVSKPLETLSDRRPPSSVLCASALASILLQFLVHLVLLLVVVSAALPFLNPNSTASIPDAAFSPTPLNSAVYLLSICITANTFACNYVGKPYMESMWENKLLSRSLMAVFACLVICVTETFLPLNQLLQLDPFPAYEDRFDKSEDDSLIMAAVKVLGFKGFLAAALAVDTAASQGAAALIKMASV